MSSTDALNACTLLVFSVVTPDTRKESRFFFQNEVGWPAPN